MLDERSARPDHPDAVRLLVGWEIVRHSDVAKNNPVHVARVLGQVLQILKKAEVPRPEMEGSITVHPLTPRDSTVSPGGRIRLTYNFSGGPTSNALTVFVHFYAENGDGSPIFGDDHDPPKRTTAWSGATSYVRDVVVPANVPPGTYRIGLGLYDPSGTGDRLELTTAGGAASAGSNRYEVGTLKVV